MKDISENTMLILMAVGFAFVGVAYRGMAGITSDGLIQIVADIFVMYVFIYAFWHSCKLIFSIVKKICNKMIKWFMKEV